MLQSGLDSPPGTKAAPAQAGGIPSLLEFGGDGNVGLEVGFSDLADMVGHRVEGGDEGLFASEPHDQEHESVLGHLVVLHVADALAPGGIQAELLSRALEPVNRLLKNRSDIAGWPVVQVGAGMEITAGGRAHALLSESERWRTDVLLAIVIAELSGLRILLVDRFDVLDLGGRSELITLLDELTYDGGIAALETAIVSGTLKQAPASLPDTMQAIWVDGGTAKTIAGKLEKQMEAA